MKRAKRQSSRPVRPGLVLVLVVALTLGIVIGNMLSGGLHNPNPVVASKLLKRYTVAAALAPSSTTKLPALGLVQSAAVHSCADNTASQLVLVSISQRHMWACAGSSSIYDSPVITGMDFLAADLTPTGTYHIYSKQTNLYLKGSDSTGSWNDYVNYWLPFLSNRYGTYGFHDATWRDNSAFGNISPDSSDASHGCVELPLATAAWLFNWAPIGTPVTIIS